MADEVDSTPATATGFGLADELALENFCLEFGLMEDQDDHVPFPLMSPSSNQEAYHREYSSNGGGGIHGSSDGWSAVSGALSFTNNGPDLEEQQQFTPPESLN